MSGEVLLYDKARQALVEARSVDDVREWDDKAAAVREYARRAGNRELELDAAEIRIRARHREGQLLLEMKAEGRLAEGRKKLSSGEDSLSEPRVTLDELAISRNESSYAQQLAAHQPDAFEQLLARWRERQKQNARAHDIDPLKHDAGPVNGGQSVAQRRVTPPDDLDYFPTPPWATRALVEVVLPRLGVEIGNGLRIWEPACGEGHISGVLAEYCDWVRASDVFDYSQDGRSPPGWDGTEDFLTPGADEWSGEDAADWIITNPPFGDKAVPFITKALERARVGVAMFVRTQWACEGITAYQRIFRSDEATLFAPFVERVPCHKGRWEPEGDTLTAYCWLVWLRDGTPPWPLFRIPPGQRKALSRPDDVVRFTAQPCLAPVDLGPILPPHDLKTGEIFEDRIVSREAEPAKHGDDNFNPEGAAEWPATGPENQGDRTVRGSIPPPSANQDSGAVSPDLPPDEAGGDVGPPVVAAGDRLQQLIDAARDVDMTEPVDDGLDIPSFLKRGSPDCIVNG